MYTVVILDIAKQCFLMAAWSEKLWYKFWFKH